MTTRYNDRRSESGIALIVVMVLMVLMGLIGIAAMETVTRDRQVAGNQNQNKMAMYAAEAALGDAKTRLIPVMNCIPPAFPACGAAINIGSPADYAAPLWGGGQPSYCADPSLGVGELPIGLVGSIPTISGEHYWLWRIRVQGQGGAGQVQRVDTVVGLRRNSPPPC